MSNNWEDIIAYLKKHEWLTKFYSSEDGWAYLTDRNGIRTKIDHTYPIELVKQIIERIKKTYE